MEGPLLGSKEVRLVGGNLLGGGLANLAVGGAQGSKKALLTKIRISSSSSTYLSISIS